MARDKLKIGLFAINCSGGVALSAHPNRHRAHWQSIKNIAIMADNNGYDYLVPLTRTNGHGGKTDPQGASFDTFAFASGVASITNNIQVFSTILASAMNPVVTARMIASIAHIGNRKNGVNVVCGWKQEELNALGITMNLDNRYDVTQEWLDIVKSLLSSTEPISYKGKYFAIENAQCKPLPDSMPDFTVAAFSPVGQEFGRQNMDLLFTMINNMDTAQYRIADIKKDTDIKVIIPTAIICRPTQKEADDFYQECSVTYADTEAIDNFSGAMFTSNPATANVQRQKRQLMALGGGSYPLIGTPDDIADEIEKLYHAGIDGILFTFINFEDEMPYFNETVLPRLRDKGII